MDKHAYGFLGHTLSYNFLLNTDLSDIVVSLKKTNY